MAIVTFTTDFGTADGYAGAMKGVVLTCAPDAVLVDITHDVPPRDVVAGAFAVATAAPLYPPGTIHVVVVDPGVGSGRADLVVAAGGQLFVGPDNGVLALAARPPRRAWRITDPRFRREQVSPTFHGRDVFAPTAGALAQGRGPAEAGPELPEIVNLGLTASAMLPDARVAHVDAFGNLVTDVSGEETAGRWMIEAGRRRLEATGGRTFADVPPGAPVVYLGSGGRLEIALRDGSAADALGVGRGARLVLRRAS